MTRRQWRRESQRPLALTRWLPYVVGALGLVAVVAADWIRPDRPAEAVMGGLCVFVLAVAWEGGRG